MFALALFLSLCGALNAPGAVDSTPADESSARAENYEAVLSRVRTERLVDPSDPRFPGLLIIGERHGGLIRLTTDLHDPMNPRTLERNFPDWILAARASLLLAYAQLVTFPDRPRPYTGLSDETRRSINAYDAEQRARIRELVRAGKYTRAWRPFATAYRKLLESAERTIPPGDTPAGDTTTLTTIAQLARDGGMFRLVRDLSIAPEDVTNEILRLLIKFRRDLGGSDDVSDRGLNLLYACGSGPLTVHVHPWHSLAPAFFHAAEAVGRKSDDAQATLIMTIFEGLSKDIAAWAAAHPDATTAARDGELNQMAKSRGFFALLEQ